MCWNRKCVNEESESGTLLNFPDAHGSVSWENQLCSATQKT